MNTKLIAISHISYCTIHQCSFCFENVLDVVGHLAMNSYSVPLLQMHIIVDCFCWREHTLSEYINYSFRYELSP
jgi:hypothetical protein